jgi:y4mF family transcriptional regulator
MPEDSNVDPQNNVDAPLTLPQAIRRRRKELQLTQDDLAALADVSRRLVETVEAGQGSPRMSSVLSLCGALGLEVVVRPGREVFRVEGL